MGWLANCLVVCGIWNTGLGRRWGWLCSCAGCSIWATIGYSLGRWDMVAIETLVGCIAFRNFLLWRNKCN